MRWPPPTACASWCRGAPCTRGPPKYFGIGRGVTSYNLVSDQCTGLHGITVPGTWRDSLVLLAVALEQHTALQPTQIMPDTGASSDVVFGLFRRRGDRFSPRLADIGGPRGWRIDARADTARVTAWHATPSTSTESPHRGTICCGRSAR